MKTTTLKNINRKSSFARVAEAAVAMARNRNVIVRFDMGPADKRRTFVAAPKKSVATLCWEWACSGLAPKPAARKSRKAEVVAAEVAA